MPPESLGATREARKKSFLSPKTKVSKLLLLYCEEIQPWKVSSTNVTMFYGLLQKRSTTSSHQKHNTAIIGTSCTFRSFTSSYQNRNSKVYWEERYALFDLKVALKDPRGLLSSWRALNCCRWYYGVSDSMYSNKTGQHH